MFSLTQVSAQELVTDQINKTLDSSQKAASDANFEKYFVLMTKGTVFIRTEATENWQNDEFRDYARPHLVQEEHGVLRLLSEINK